MGDQKKIWSPLNNWGVLSGDQKNLVVIQHNSIVEWRLKNFDCHPRHPCHWMATKFFWLPKKESKGIFFFPKNYSIGPTLFSCHLMVGVCWMAIEIFWSPKKGEVHVISFLKKLIAPCPFGRLKFFSCHSMVGCVRWQLKKIGCHSTHPHCLMVIEFFQSARKRSMSYIFGKPSTYDI